MERPDTLRRVVDVLCRVCCPALIPTRHDALRNVVGPGEWPAVLRALRREFGPAIDVMPADMPATVGRLAQRIEAATEAHRG
ncbi:hypothetical protein [Roseomonas sp. BN140053]|uniref:hypothetical protein n=1 Tax=Roseomonas sp. BN140053 TaxID=3391898 RepID=UPI0039EB459D